MPHPEKIAYWQSLALLAKSFLPGTWLAFSLVYSSGNYLEFLATWKFFLAIAFLFRSAFRSASDRSCFISAPVYAEQGWGLSFGGAGKTLNILSLIVA